jgi:hypothetical protein
LRLRNSSRAAISSATSDSAACFFFRKILPPLYFAHFKGDGRKIFSQGGSGMNIELKAALIRACGSQSGAARTLGVSESRLSRLVQGWAEPTTAEIEKFKLLIGERLAVQLFKRSSRGGFDTS